MAGGVVVPGWADFNHSSMRFASVEHAAVAGDSCALFGKLRRKGNVKKDGHL